jgi:RimJ/RimL family protein N-acetyltransferase
MKRPFAQSWVQDDLHKHLTFCTALIAGVLDIPEDENAATTPLEPHHDVIILGLPFKSLWDTKQNRIVGDIGMSPDLEPLTPGGPQRTEDQVLASPLASQTWHLGYVLEPAAHGRGIMSEVIGVLLESWVRPIMRVENVVAIVENNNKGSHKVIDKNGFNKIKEVVTDWPVEKGGGKRYSGYYVWKRGGDGSDDERIMRNLQNRRNNMAVDVDDSDSDYAGGDISMNSSALPSPAIANLVDEDSKMMSPARSPLRESANSTD